jgi:hypothetical protein
MYIDLHLKYPLFLPNIDKNHFLERFLKIFKFYKNPSCEHKLYHAGRTDRHGEANSRFRNFAKVPMKHNQRANQLMGSFLKSQLTFYWPAHLSCLWNPKVYTVLIL